MSGAMGATCRNSWLPCLPDPAGRHPGWQGSMSHRAPQHSPCRSIAVSVQAALREGSTRRRRARYLPLVAATSLIQDT